MTMPYSYRTDHTCLIVSTDNIQTAILAYEYLVAALKPADMGRLGYKWLNGKYWIGMFRTPGQPQFSDEEMRQVSDILHAFIAGRGEGWA